MYHIRHSSGNFCFSLDLYFVLFQLFYLKIHPQKYRIFLKTNKKLKIKQKHLYTVHVQVQLCEKEIL